jgi:hypothetical protein
MLKMETVPVWGSMQPRTEEFPELSLISYEKPIAKYLAFEPRVSSLRWDAKI